MSIDTYDTLEEAQEAWRILLPFKYKAVLVSIDGIVLKTKDDPYIVEKNPIIMRKIDDYIL